MDRLVGSFLTLSVAKFSELAEDYAQVVDYCSVKLTDDMPKL